MNIIQEPTTVQFFMDQNNDKYKKFEKYIQPLKN